MSAAYTPGPWFAVNAGTKQEPMMEVRAARIAGREPRHCVAICATGDSPQPMEDANARLISAAPELLSALQSLFNYDSLDAYERADAMVAARAAIAKATGVRK